MKKTQSYVSRLTEMTCHIGIPKAEARKMQKILNGKELTSKQMFNVCGSLSRDTIKTYTACFKSSAFDTQMEMDIKVCNGDTPFVDAVLFDDGHEVDVMDVSDTLLGEYTIEYDGVTYKVIVREV